MRVLHVRSPRFLQKTSTGCWILMIILSYSLAACDNQNSPVSVPVCSQTGTHNRQIIFLHGVNQNASMMGLIQNPASADVFVPLLESLKCVYNPANVHVFQYLDDQALATSSGGCPAGLYPPCVSQGSVGDDAASLASVITSLRLRGNQKVTIIAYSMGGVITRSMLAGCPYTTTDTNGSSTVSLACNVASMVSDVFFINVPQQGSWLLALKQSLDTSGNPLEIALGWAGYAVAKSTMGLDATYPAEQDMTPGSPNILLRDQQPMPSGIHYFNFFGDIHLHPVTDLLDFIIPGASSATIQAGDLVILPGTDDTQLASATGGSRFCARCGTQDSSGYSSSTSSDGTSYSQWALTNSLSWNYDVLAQFIQLVGEGLPEDKGLLLLGNVVNAPEAHLKIYSDDSLFNTSTIQVEDQTGRGGKTSITNEILWQLEKEDGITQ